jgi:hypothetical protein
MISADGQYYNVSSFFEECNICGTLQVHVADLLPCSTYWP